MHTTSSSSAQVIAFPTAVTTELPKFESWRETWLRKVVADPKLGHRAKTVATVLSFYLNRESRACFPSYETIAQAAGIVRQSAMQGVAELIEAGYLQRQSRE